MHSSKIGTKWATVCSLPQASIAVADQDWKHVYLAPTVWLCFLTGAAISGYIISYERWVNLSTLREKG